MSGCSFLNHDQIVLRAHGWAWDVVIWGGLGIGGPSVDSISHVFPFCFPQSVLKKRDQVQAEYEAKLEAVALRKEDRPKVRKATSKGWATMDL
jgi:hypothetical protein